MKNVVSLVFLNHLILSLSFKNLEATATRLRQSKPKNPQNIQTKTHKIPKPIHKKTQIFQHKSNQNSQTTATPPLRRTTKTKRG